jgi:3-methyl-2-oxobutanoate hydroxymethyltransferase
MSLARLGELKRAGKKIVAVVCWDTPTARIADGAGVDLVSVGDSVGVNLWGQKEGEITLDELLVVARAVRRGVKRALLSCDLPEKSSPGDAIRLLRESGADLVKILASPDVIRDVVKKGVPVFAEMHGDKLNPHQLVAEAKRLEAAGATMIDFRHSGPVAGAAVAKAVAVPVIGGLGGGPWLDGRVRRIDVLIGYPPKQADALHAYAEDVRNARTLQSDRA